MRIKPAPIAAAYLLLLAASLAPCRAQWMTQEIALNPGWNAVHLNVEPARTDCASVFAELPVQSVWMWNRRPTRLQFTTDPARLLPRNPDWLFWLPPSQPPSRLNSLFAVHGGQSYLIRLRADATPLTWRLKGTPVLFRRQWLPQSLNLTGLPVPPHTTTFDSFLRPCSAIGLLRTDGGEILQVDSSGHGVNVWQPARVVVQSGRAYWIRCKDATAYVGPLRVELDYGRRLEFSAGGSTRRLKLRNDGLAVTTATVRGWPSEIPPAGTAALAGDVPLSYREQDWSQGLPRDIYRPLAPSVARALAPGQTWTLELTVRRQDLAAAPAGAYWQSLLEVTDGAAVRQWVGVQAQ